MPGAPSPAYGGAPAAPWGPAPTAPGAPVYGAPMAPAYGAPAAPGYAAAPGYPQATPGYAQAAPGYAQAAPAAPKKNTGLIIGIIVLVVLIIGALIFFFVPKNSQNDPNKPVPAGQATNADAAVRGYLQALAAGNSADALSFLDSPPTDAALLTDEVLAFSNANNPISNITTDSSAGYTVAATFDIGSQNVTANFYATQYGKYYKLSYALQSVYIPSADSGVTMKINGVSFTQSSYSVTLFPGYYEVTVDNSLLTVTNGEFYVSGSNNPDTSRMSIDLVSDAQGQFQDAATAQLDACMAEKAIMTSCGFGVSSSNDSSGNPVDIDVNSIVWSYRDGSSDDFSDADFSWSSYSGLTARAYQSVYLEVDVNATNGHAYYKNVSLYSVSVDFTDPSNLVVTFD